MNDIKILFGFLVLLLLVYYFIKTSNDYIECEAIKTTRIDPNGNKITEVKHFCKEKYSF